jgi:acyl-CoA reductase-like NAD-dependent aldehyde dehydrogenase
MKKGYKLNFDIVNKQALNIASIITARRDELLNILTRYETYKTAVDEIERSLDVLTNLHENQSYFQTAVGQVAVFMPSNQPLYSLTCFAIIPALMSEKVCVKAPETTKGFYEDMLEVLKIKEQPFSIEYMKFPRSQCVDIFTAIKVDKETGLEQPVFEVVIFTGTSKNADILRKRFHKSVLFIANGSGHNPLVVTDTADIEKAVDAIMSVRSYNQGQDCASPNSILVHAKVYNDILNKLRKAVINLKVGAYNSPTTDIGPISRPDTLILVEEFLAKNHQYIDNATDGVIRTRSNIVEPTIITKPLRDGANFEEVFAPVFIIQKYDTDKDLSLYFEDKQYASNAMYVTVFGKSDFIEQFVTHDKVGSKLHDSSTVIYNTDLHKPGVERGVFPYGGYGRGASCVSKNGNILSKPTLPQREIFEYLVQGKSIESLKGDKPKQQFLTKKVATINLDELLKLYTPEILRWLYAKNSAKKLFSQSIEKDTLRHYSEFDTALESLSNGLISNLDSVLLNLAGVDAQKNPISFRQLLGLGQSVHWNKEKLKKLLRYQELPYDAESIYERFPRVKHWLENYNQEQIVSLGNQRNEVYFRTMPQAELLQVKDLHDYLANNIGKNLSLKDIETKLYNIAKAKDLSKQETKERQRKFFKNLYNLLIGSDTGPRLSTFIWAADQITVLSLLDTGIS